MNFLANGYLPPASLMAQRLKRLPAMQETWVRSLGWEDPLEKEMATHSSILAWRIPWAEEPGGLQSTGLQRVRHDWAPSLSIFITSGFKNFFNFSKLNEGIIFSFLFWYILKNCFWGWTFIFLMFFGYFCLLHFTHLSIHLSLLTSKNPVYI